MNYSKQYIAELSRNSAFLAGNVEKVVRLLNVLEFIFKDYKSILSSKLVLKGGTAINLMYTNLSRLSVDIDLDYIGSIDKETAAKDKQEIFDRLDDYMIREGYTISSKSRGSAILESRVYSYRNASGNLDNIKVEINFIDRVHVGPLVSKKVNYFNKEVSILTLDANELYGMKIAALINRSKPRDLYDIYQISDLSGFDNDSLRKCAIFYLSLDRIYEINEKSFDGIKAINNNQVKRELLPVLAKAKRFELEYAKEEVINMLTGLLVPTEEEKQYLISLSNGEYKPELLFDNHVANRIANHPMAKWIIKNS